MVMDDVREPLFDIAPYRELYPWQGHYFDVGDGIRMHYLDEGYGDGEVLVMLHGNPTWSIYWRNLIRGLGDRYRIIVPDHVGCGLSDKPDDSRYDYVLSQRVDDLEALLERVDATTNITLVVHDWGGMIGMSYATRNPERVKRMIILNTAGFGLPEGQKLPWQIASVRHFPWLSFLVRGLNVFSRGANVTCSTRPGGMPDLVKRAYLAPYNSWANRIAVQRFVEDIPLKPGDASWAAINEVSEKFGQLAQVPMLICWGRKDFVFNDAFLAEWRKRIPKAIVHSFYDAGHYVLEDAHEEILPLIQNFLRSNPIDAA